MKRLFLCLALVALLGAAPSLAADNNDADDNNRPRSFGHHGWGFRFGVGDDPDQVVAGVQFDHGEFEMVHLEPNIELSIGDNHTTLAATYAVHYRFRYVEQFRPYVGGGLGVAVDRFDPPGNGDSDTDFDIGLRFLGGFNWDLKSARQAFVEVIVGVGFPYDAQIMAGWTF